MGFKLDVCNTVFSLCTAVAAGVGVWLVYSQLLQANELKQFENFNMFNKVYDDWYANMPAEFRACKNGKAVKWNDLEHDDRAWVRRYFNLYAQEYYFFKKQMIPRDMWEQLIHGENGCHGAAMFNLREYPILLEGYEWWKLKGAFGYPSSFTEMLDAKIKECKDFLKDSPNFCKK